jgi:tetratricopeptide (TPR) repeat protein
LKFLVEQLFYNTVIYKSLDETIKNDVRKFLAIEPDDELIERVKAILLKLTNTGNFIVLIDDINLAEEFSLLILKQFVQVLQVNNIKTVIAENSDKEYFSQKINNCQIYNLVPFTKDETDLFLETSYAGFFPKNLTLDLIMKYADLLPGSVVSFIKDLITLEILGFGKNGPTITVQNDKLALLEKYQSEVFKLRVDKLDSDELYLANVLSLFDSNFTSKEIQILLNTDSKKFDLLLKGLSEKNILANENLSTAPAFVNQGLKKYIYTQIENKSDLHLQIGTGLKKHFAELHLFEQGRQFELAGDYEQSFFCYYSEIQKAKKLSAFSYERRILYQTAAMPLSEKQKFIVNFELCKVLLTIDALNECLEKIDETSIIVNNDKDKTELEIIKGNCLIKLGQLNEGIELLQKSISNLNNKTAINELKLEIASAEFDLGNYSLVKKLVTEVINSSSSSKESIGRSYTILGLIEYYENTNLDNAIVEFTNANQIFNKYNLVSRQAGIELNLGNLYDIIGDPTKAEKHWDKAVELNLAVGNFEQEAYIQLNYGIYYFNKLNFEKSIKLYKRALNIFNTTGNLKGQGLVLSNLGEVYITTCEYQLSIDTLEKAESIFMKTRNIEEEVHVIFLVCKLYYILGLLEQLKSKVNSLENIVSRNKISAKHELYIKYHNQMLLILDANKHASINELINIRDEFEKQGEKRESAFLTIQIAYQLLKVNLYSDAVQLLMIESFNKICKQNKLIFAEREFILGLIASENNDTELLPSIEHFEKAFNYLENESITELTWKVTFKIAEYYFNRGNLHKAKDYIVYSKSLLKYISGGIKNLKIRNAYLSRNERSSVLETLEKFETKY